MSSLIDGSFAPAATDLTGLVFIRLGGVAFVAASGTATNTGEDGSWIYEATQAETDQDANEIEVRVVDATWYAQTFAEIVQPDEDPTAPSASEIADEVESRTLDVNVATLDPAAVADIQAEILDELLDLAALLHRNSVVDNAIRDLSTGFLTSARIRQFASPANASSATVGAANGADGEIARYTLTATHIGGKMTSHRIVKVYP